MNGSYIPQKKNKNIFQYIPSDMVWRFSLAWFLFLSMCVALLFTGMWLEDTMEIYDCPRPTTLSLLFSIRLLFTRSLIFSMSISDFSEPSNEASEYVKFPFVGLNVNAGSKPKAIRYLCWLKALSCLSDE